MIKSEILLDIVTSLRSLATSIEVSAASMMMEAEPTADTKASPAPTAKEEIPAPKVITLEEIRAILGEKSMAGFTAEIRDLLVKHGATKLSQIDSANYPALLADAEALK